MQVLTEAIGAEVLFADTKDGGDLVASGIKFIHGGTTHRAYANKEVILAAGSAFLTEPVGPAPH